MKIIKITSSCFILLFLIILVAIFPKQSVFTNSKHPPEIFETEKTVREELNSAANESSSISDLQLKQKTIFSAYLRKKLYPSIDYCLMDAQKDLDLHHILDSLVRIGSISFNENGEVTQLREIKDEAKFSKRINKIISDKKAIMKNYNPSSIFVLSTDKNGYVYSDHERFSAEFFTNFKRVIQTYDSLNLTNSQFFRFLSGMKQLIRLQSKSETDYYRRSKDAITLSTVYLSNSYTQVDNELSFWTTFKERFAILCFGENYSLCHGLVSNSKFAAMQQESLNSMTKSAKVNFTSANQSLLKVKKNHIGNLLAYLIFFGSILSIILRLYLIISKSIKKHKST